MRAPDAAARRVLRGYRSASRGAAVHTTVRWWTCPIAAIDELVPADGDVLDVGCGHGLVARYLAERSAGRRVVGVDVDAAKVAIGASVVAEGASADRVELRAVDAGWRPEPASVDAVVVVDVLYLLGRAEATDLLADLVAALRPGGVVVVKEMALTPRWKYLVNEVQERLATRVLRITEGDQLEVLDPDVIAAALRAAGSEVEVRRLDRGYPHAHAAVVGRRPRGDAAD